MPDAELGCSEAFPPQETVEVLDESACGRTRLSQPERRFYDRDDASLKSFATFLKANSPRCGQIRDTQREYLFRSDESDVGSVALVPLGKKAEIGFLAIGSIDGDRFHPGMSIDFLARVGDLVAGALKKF